MEDREIIRLFLLRSENAISELSQKYGGLCMKLAFNILGDREDAEECVNDAYLAIWDTISCKRKPQEKKGQSSSFSKRISVVNRSSNTSSSTIRTHLNFALPCVV